MNKIRIGILHHSFVWTTKFNRERVEVKKLMTQSHNGKVTQMKSIIVSLITLIGS